MTDIEKNLTSARIVELRTKCIELAIERDAYPTTEAAEHYYNFIIKNTSSSKILEAASEFISKVNECSDN